MTFVIVSCSVGFSQDDEALIQSRKQVIKLYQNSYQETRQLSCAKQFADNNFLAAVFYPQGKANELYVFNYGEAEYYLVQNGNIHLLWSAKVAENSEQGQSLPADNTYAKWLNRDDLNFDYIQCGTLPSYQGELEMFKSLAQTAYQGIVGIDGQVNCETEIANTFDEDTALQDYWYGVATCSNQEK